MKRYDRYEDGIVIDNQKGENNLLELIRLGDMLEEKETNYVEYIKVNSEDDLRNIQNENAMLDILAIWFRSGDKMTRYELKGENE